MAELYSTTGPLACIVIAQDVGEYLIVRAQEAWMEDLMVACEEIHGEELQFYRSRGAHVTGVHDLTKEDQRDEGEVQSAAGTAQLCIPEGSTAAMSTPASAKPEAEALQIKKRNALQWVTGSKDGAMLLGLMASLPETVLQEQVVRFENRPSLTGTVAVAAKPKLKITNRVADIMKIVQALHEYLQLAGATNNACQARFPRHSIKRFLQERCVFQRNAGIKCPGRWLKYHYNAWIKEGQPEPREELRSRKEPSSLGLIQYYKRKRKDGGGRNYSMPLVRQWLYDWFVALRYNIDWNKYAERLQARGRHRCIGRFPISLIRVRLNQLTEDYMRECLLNGTKVNVPRSAGDWRWTLRWMREYGLSLRKANRRYKCPKWLVAQRLEIWWLSLAKVRALCIECFGYDPEMENFDQSPFHNNETGAQNKKILAVATCDMVPLIEGRNDVLERWTANLTTFSNAERIVEEGPPYCELMFKATAGGSVEYRLREHVRKRGYGSWLTVACQEKGSYRETDILTFLETHLTPWNSQSRRWRIIMADDYGPHKSMKVFKWLRFA